MRSLRLLFVALGAALVALAPRAALAQRAAQAVPTGAPPADATTDFDGAPKKRAGVVIGLDLGVGLAGASGYPNDSNKIDDPNYYGASGMLTGTGGSIFFMGALADYLNFGFWFGRQSAQNGDWRSSGVGGGFRVEAFPLYTLLPKLSDLGVMAKFGIGSATLDAKRGEYPGADGVQSYLGAGVFYEWSLGRALGGHFALGPTLEFDAIYSRPIERHGLLAGGRFVWYGGK